MTVQEFVEEFKHTWPRHRGIIEIAAPIFNSSPETLERRLYRARAKGYDIEFHRYQLAGSE
jgi:hypothetical protein